jgi:pectinesterase
MKSKFIFLVAIFFSLGARAEDVTNTAHKIKIILVGDSTVNDQGGWGWGFKQFVKPDVEVFNTAANGRSSKSFMDEGKWTNALALHGDYYFIQFGHNDEPGKGPTRETDSATTYPQLLAKYVAEVRAIGAKPVLVTSLTRRMFAADGKLKPNLLPYVDAMKKLAAEKNVALIDLHTSSVALCEKLGPEEAARFNPTVKDKPDTTHLKGEARVVFARLVVDELRAKVPELASHLLSEPNRDAVKTLKEKSEVLEKDESKNTKN